MTTTTLLIGGAQLTVATEELFRAWMEKHITTPAAAIARPPLQEAKLAEIEGRLFVGGRDDE